MVVQDSTKTTRTLWICVPIRMILVKRHAAKQSLQRSLNNQILDYKAMLDLCENEMMLIKFFRICKESMISVENLERWYECGDTVPGTRSSHHFVPLPSSRIGHKLTSEDKSYVDIHDFNVPTLFWNRRYQSISLCYLYVQLVLMGCHG